VSLKGIQRIETFPAPYKVMRELVLNAVAHRNYRNPNPVQIKVFSDEIYIFSIGGFPIDWDIDKLLGLHESKSLNPKHRTDIF
jgi:ATP-dependent DNA helicase RecG